MTPSQTIQLQALKLKAVIDGQHSNLIDAILEDPDNKDTVKKEFRNVCALVSMPMFNELERLCSTLDMSKREFITLALSEFIPKADAIIAEVDPFENAEEAQKAVDDIGAAIDGRGK